MRREDTMEIVIGLIIGLAIGGVVTWLVRREASGLRVDAATLRADLDDVRGKLQDVEQQRTEAAARLEERSSLLQRTTEELAEERQRAGELRDSLGIAREELSQSESDRQARIEELDKKQEEIDALFKSIAADVAKASNEEFRKQAAEEFKRQRELAGAELDQRRQQVEALVKPINENLERLRKDYGGVDQLINAARQEIRGLQETTGGLRQALSAPQQRGRWGELTLERVLEVAGMREHITYERQVQASSEEQKLRPDAVIHMPGGLTVPVDAKTPLSSYLKAHDAVDDVSQRQALEQHARTLMNHAGALGAKAYTEAIDGLSPDFVVLFVPTETILDAAMIAQPTIWEDAWTRHRVLIASPGLLIALLRTVGVAWQQEDIQRNAQAIADDANELYSRLATYTSHVDRIGGALTSAVKAYNDGVGSYERRVLAQARRMEKLGVISDAKRIETPRIVDEATRQLNAPELGAESD
ncbi:MAG: DNA recombination protein RmuC [Chloroflexi bacterium]|nr:DNA recombination protein RmuC [Chloroflexota bacterium]MYF80943.1 DNA recombination protein RmuC [Chloroflexota bacterium]MYI04334.1 DNA recombination protein RmuC [Chloroflexota bacterium]